MSERSRVNRLGRVSGGASPLAILLVVSISYLATLLALDRGRSAFDRLAEIAPILPGLALASFVSYALRFARWRRLLASIGYPTPLARGFLAYLAGFAFTATPGKVGELIRIRYFAAMGVPHARVVSCFIIERSLDLVVLLLLASLIAGQARGLAAAVAFVAFVLVAVIALGRARRLRRWLQHLLRVSGYRRLARWTRVLMFGISATAQFATPRLLVPAAVLGVAAWTIQCLGFALALWALGVALPWRVLFSVPPAAMLIGAASMVPGGIGTTEAATVVLLAQFGADLDSAVLAAIAMRLGSIWVAVIVGFGAMWWLEKNRQLPDENFNPDRRGDGLPAGHRDPD